MTTNPDIHGRAAVRKFHLDFVHLRAVQPE
jgi:hypothetical protein